jgi:hypothetical protein
MGGGVSKSSNECGPHGTSSRVLVLAVDRSPETMAAFSWLRANVLRKQVLMFCELCADPKARRTYAQRMHCAYLKGDGMHVSAETSTVAHLCVAIPSRSMLITCTHPDVPLQDTLSLVHVYQNDSKEQEARKVVAIFEELCSSHAIQVFSCSSRLRLLLPCPRSNVLAVVVTCALLQYRTVLVHGSRSKIPRLLATEAQCLNARLVILGCRGLSTVQRTLRGSVVHVCTLAFVWQAIAGHLVPQCARAFNALTKARTFARTRISAPTHARSLQCR